MLYQHFRKYGVIESVDVKRDPLTNKSIGLATIEFAFVDIGIIKKI